MGLSRRELFIGGAASAALLGVCGRVSATETTVRIGYFDSYAPFSFLNDQGAMAGLLVTANQAILEKAGLSAEHHGYPWARAQALVQDGGLDAVCTNPTDHRRSYLLFCQTPVIAARIGFFHRKDDARFGAGLDRQAARQFRLGDFIGNDWARQNLSDFEVEWTPTEEHVFKKVAHGRIDAFVSQEITAYHKLRRLGLEEGFSFTPAPFLGGFAFTFGLRRTFPDVEAAVSRIETATHEMELSGALAQIRAPYLG